MLLGLIIACEIAFWIFIAAGLTARYLLHRPKLGGALLVASPLVDLVLLVVVIIDLRNGATAHWNHGLAAAYLGFSVAFGHSMIKRADVWAAHRFGDGPPPVKPPKYGAGRARYEWQLFGRAALGWAVTCALLGLGILVVGDAERTEAFVNWLRVMSLGIGAWGLIALSYTIFPKKAPAEASRYPTGG